MSLPQTMFQLLALLALVVPGFTHSVARRRLVGPGTDEKDFSTRLARAISVSVVLDCLYIVLGWPLIREFWSKDAQGTSGYQHPQKAASVIFVLAFVIPGLLALAGQIRLLKEPVPQDQRRWWQRISLGWKPIWHPAPSAWDAHAPELGGHYVAIRTGDGAWVGGYLPDKGGYVSTYPEPRDIFIPQPYEINDDVQFVAPVPNGRGLFVPLTGSERVYWFAPGDSSSPDGSNPSGPPSGDGQQ